jgi:uncharacterized tellurite resistance protein B-like protein
MSHTLNFGKQYCACGDGRPPRPKFAFEEDMGRQKMFRWDLSRPMEARSRLATAALLVRVATIDGDMSDVKSKHLCRILMSSFGLDDSSAAQLIEDACAAERGAIDLYQFTRQLNETLDGNGRHQSVLTG